MPTHHEWIEHVHQLATELREAHDEIARLQATIRGLRADNDQLYDRITRSVTLEEAEYELIMDALDRHAGDKPAAATELGIALKTLYNRINAAPLRIAR